MSASIPFPEFCAGDSPTDQLVKLSRYYGSDIEFAIAGGGNTSVKLDNRLYIKASGTALATIDASGFVEMDRTQLDQVLDLPIDPDVNSREARFKEAILAARVYPLKGQRPSIECLLHHILPHRFVVHTHPTAANSLTCARNGEATARALFGEEILWIPYVDPGLILARSVHRALAEFVSRRGGQPPRALLLENHGLFVAGNSPEEVRDTTDWIVGTLRGRIAAGTGSNPFGPVSLLPEAEARALLSRLGPMLRGLLGEGEFLKIVSFDDSDTVGSLVGSQRGMEVAAAGPTTPDQIVYCRSFPLCFEPKEAEGEDELLGRLKAALEEYRRINGASPLVVLIRGLGLFTVGEHAAEAERIRLCYRDAVRVAAGAEQLGGVRAMSARDRDFIETWEVEAYRRQVAAGRRSAGRMCGKVVLVTGAAQGFGREIAEALAAEDAHVVLADMNAAGVQQAAGELAERYGAGRAVGLAVDVTLEDSVAEAIHQVVRCYGGLDLLISNAGILRAGAVTTQSVKEFEQVTRVNYTGYFICVQKAAPVLARQHRANPAYWSDIIQINSKSGLVGSKRNSAYAGGKFGAIGLTQSFALELVEEGIKVNAICPGNYFDGPLWSDPENGLFIQYLRAGKVPGARTVEDVKKAYEAMVPMGRGCTPADVVRAIYYLTEQKYETGQALPVTGGQVMLR